MTREPSSSARGKLGPMDDQIVERAVVAERDCYVDWIEALRSVPGNPWRAEVGRFGEAVVVACGGCPARIVNRCFGLTGSSIARLGEILDFFAEHDADPSIDLNPFADYGDDDSFFAALWAHELSQVGFHQILVGRVVDCDQAPHEEAGSVTIKAVREEAAAAYAQIHERVFGPGMLITALLSHARFHCFLAEVDGRPAALGVLHVRGAVASMANAITLPEFRNRGLQLSLLRRRIDAARELNCDLIVSQASPRNVSMRNQLRAGLSFGGTKAIWGRRPSRECGAAVRVSR